MRDVQFGFFVIEEGPDEIGNPPKSLPILRFIDRRVLEARESLDQPRAVMISLNNCIWMVSSNPPERSDARNRWYSLLQLKPIKKRLKNHPEVSRGIIAPLTDESFRMPP